MSVSIIQKHPDGSYTIKMFDEEFVALTANTAKEMNLALVDLEACEEKLEKKDAYIASCEKVIEQYANTHGLQSEYIEGLEKIQLKYKSGMIRCRMSYFVPSERHCHRLSQNVWRRFSQKTKYKKGKDLATETLRHREN